MADGNSKRGKVTPENEEEARLLSVIWYRRKAEALKAGKPFTQASFGHDFDVGNQSAVGFFLNGKTALSAKAAAAFARGLGCKVADFSKRLAAIMDVPQHDAPWPFPDINPRRFDDLAATWKIEMQGVVRDRIETYERMAKAETEQRSRPQPTPEKRQRRGAR